MRIRRAVVGLIAALTLAGCGAGTTGSSGSSTVAGQPARPTSGSAAIAGLTVDITIAGGTLTPTNAQLTATVGQPIVLQVSSDTDDELHVHSVPDHEFEVTPGHHQSFEFTVDVPGTVEVELHHLNRTVASIQVRP